MCDENVNEACEKVAALYLQKIIPSVSRDISGNAEV
jgi:hypothetical protein